MKQMRLSRPAARADHGLPFPPFPTPAEIQRHVARGRMLRAETSAVILRSFGRAVFRSGQRLLAASGRRLAAPAIGHFRQP